MEERVDSRAPYRSPGVGDVLPWSSADALMPDGTFGSVSLEDYKGKFLVLFTYPLDFTFVCPTGESGTPARVCRRS